MARSKSQIARDRKKIANLYLKGTYQYDIADELKISQSTVSRDLKALQKDWQKSSLIDIDKKKAEELAKVDRLEIEYWEGWHESQKDAETVREESSRQGKKKTVISKGQAGDPRFLAGIQSCINKRCELLGLDAPKKLEHSGEMVHKGYVNVSPDDWPDKPE